MAKRNRDEIEATKERLGHDSELIPVGDVPEFAGHPASIIIRWIVMGRAGVHLDGLQERGQWFTSREAVARFQQASRERREPQPAA